MTYRPMLTSRSLIPVAALLAVVIVAICPRSLLAPSLSFNQAQESKRPKTPKNIVRMDSADARAAQRSWKFPKTGPAAETASETAGLTVRPTLASGVPDRAFSQISLPEYLKLFSGSPPGNRLSPPA
jgi:hypothetical protein